MTTQCSALKPVLSSPITQNQYKSCRSARSSVTYVPWEVQIPPNSVRRTRTSMWFGGSSLGVDLGFARTSVAIGKGTTVCPLMVSELQGEKLEKRLLDLAEEQEEEVDEFIIGLPKIVEGRERENCRVRRVAERLTVGAAERGRRVYLLNEDVTSLDHIIAEGLYSKRGENFDANTAVKLLQRYFWNPGKGIEVMVPKEEQLLYNIIKGRPTLLDYF